MGRLIEADNLKRYIIETYHDPIIVCNDDEVHFVAEIIDDYPTVEAIPKDQYEARLKADMMAMLEDLRLDFQEAELAGELDNKELIFADEADDLIQQKINSLKQDTKQ